MTYETEENEQSEEREPIIYQYVFKFQDGSFKNFTIELDPYSLNCISPVVTTAPEWTRLTFKQCDNCPLEAESNPFCPVALNIAGVVSSFRNISSYENTYVMVMTRQRDYSKNTTIEEALSSLMGIYMVTSGCPVMEKLKPLVRYHLPFATLHESVVRVISHYLLIQFFLMKKKRKKPDWDLKKLEKIYEDIMQVNEGMANRFQSAANKDASVTALSNLNFMASVIPFLLTDTYEEIEQSLSSYFEEASPVGGGEGEES